jgi:hypothetical protein
VLGAGSTSLLQRLEQQLALGKLATLETLAKEVVGINAPKMLITRSPQERAEVSLFEVGNTIGFFGGGALLEKAVDSMFGLHPEKFGPWQRVGKSFGMYAMLFGFMTAMAFIRNYYTAKKTGSTAYTQVIGAETTQQLASHHQAKLDQHLVHLKKQIFGILGAGAGLGLGMLLLSKQAASRQLAVPGWVKAIDNFKIQFRNSSHRLVLPNSKFLTDFGILPGLLFWGLPSYAGAIAASRDQYEAKEQVLKFINFSTFFAVPSILAQALTKNRLAGFAIGLGSSIALLGVSPVLLNIALTQKRLERDRTFKSSLAHRTLPAWQFNDWAVRISAQRAAQADTENRRIGASRPLFSAFALQ